MLKFQVHFFPKKSCKINVLSFNTQIYIRVSDLARLLHVHYPYKFIKSIKLVKLRYLLIRAKTSFKLFNKTELKTSYVQIEDALSLSPFYPNFAEIFKYLNKIVLNQSKDYYTNKKHIHNKLNIEEIVLSSCDGNSSNFKNYNKDTKMNNLSLDEINITSDLSEMENNINKNETTYDFNKHLETENCSSVEQINNTMKIKDFNENITTESQNCLFPHKNILTKLEESNLNEILESQNYLLFKQNQQTKQFNQNIITPDAINENQIFNQNTEFESQNCLQNFDQNVMFQTENNLFPEIIECDDNVSDKLEKGKNLNSAVINENLKSDVILNDENINFENNFSAELNNPTFPNEIINLLNNEELNDFLQFKNDKNKKNKLHQQKNTLKRTFVEIRVQTIEENGTEKITNPIKFCVEENEIVCCSCLQPKRQRFI